MSSRKNSTKQLLTVAFCCILLGVGNVVFGNIKRADYSEALAQAQSELADAPAQPLLPLFNPTVNMDLQDQYINRLVARISFYEFVSMGGRCLLALAGIFLVLAAALHQLRADEHH